MKSFIKVSKIIFLLQILVPINLSSQPYWQQTNGPRDPSAIIDIGSSLLACSYGGGIFKSTDFGQSWFEVNYGLSTRNVFNLKKEKNNIYASTADGIYFSVNNGNTWQNFSLSFPPVYVFATEFQGNNIVAGTNGNGIVVSFDQGKKWYTSNSGLPKTSGAYFVNSLAYDYVNLYEACDNSGLYMSAGISDWKPAMRVSTGNCRLVTIINNKVFAVIDGKLFWTENNGTTWNTTKISIPYITCLASDNNRIYAGTINGVYYTDDLEDYWKYADWGQNIKINKLLKSSNSWIIGTDENIFYYRIKEDETKEIKNVSKWIELKDGWFGLPKGNKKNDFIYDKKYVLSYKGIACKEKISLSTYTNGIEQQSFLPTIYISSISPNGQFVFITGCEEMKIEDCSFTLFKLLDLKTMELFDANNTKYGPQLWVKWSKNNKYAILYDASAGLLQSYNLSTKEIKTIPTAEKPGVGTLYNISSENKWNELDSKGNWASVVNKSFKWNNDETKFIVKMNVYNSNNEIIRSYKAEVDILSGKVFEVK